MEDVLVFGGKVNGHVDVGYSDLWRDEEMVADETCLGSIHPKIVQESAHYPAVGIEDALGRHEAVGVEIETEIYGMRREALGST